MGIFITIFFFDSFKQVLESENLFVDSFATHLLASCSCANRNQIRQAYDHLNKTSSNHFWVKFNRYIYLRINATFISFF